MIDVVKTPIHNYFFYGGRKQEKAGGECQKINCLVIEGLKRTSG
jgi:hypothetical protein